MARQTINFRFARADEAEAASQFHIQNPATGVYHRDMPYIERACSNDPSLYLFLTCQNPNGTERIVGTGATYMEPGEGRYAEFGSMRVLDGLKEKILGPDNKPLKNEDGTDQERMLFSFRGYKLSSYENMISAVHAFLYAPPTNEYFADVKQKLDEPNRVFKDLKWDRWDNIDPEAEAFFKASKAGDTREAEPVYYYRLDVRRLPEFARKIIELANNPELTSRDGKDTLTITGLKKLPFWPYLEHLAKMNPEALANSDSRPGREGRAGFLAAHKYFWDNFDGSHPKPRNFAMSQRVTGWQIPGMAVRPQT